MGAARHLRLVGPLVGDISVAADVDTTDGEPLLTGASANAPLSGDAHPAQVQHLLASSGSIAHALLLDDEALRLVGADAGLHLRNQHLGLRTKGEGALDQLLRPAVLGRRFRQLVGDSDLAAGVDALLLGDELLRLLGVSSGQLDLLLDGLRGKAQRQGAAHQVQRDAFFVGDLRQVFGNFR